MMKLLLKTQSFAAVHMSHQMRLTKILTFVIASLLFCSAASSSAISVLPRGGWVVKQSAPASGVPATFASEFRKRDVILLDKNNQRVGVINDGDIPFVDKTGLLYLEKRDEPNIDIYEPPYTGKPLVINFGSEQVHSMAIDQITGMFAVNAQVRSNGAGRLHFFRRGQTTPCAIVTGSAEYPLNAGATFDAEGTLFFNVTSTITGKSLIASSADGCNAKTIQVYQFTTKISPQVGMGFDKNDDLVLQNWYGLTPLTLFTFAHPKNGVFGAPISETVPRQYNGVYPQFLSMGSDGAHVWLGYLGTTLGYYNYPAGGKPVTLLEGLPDVNGVAVLPPLVP